MKVIKKTKQHLPCKLTEDELKAKSRELATTVQEINSEEDRQKNIKDQLKAKMSELESRQSRLAGEVAREEVYRDVEVEVRYDDKSDKVTEVRTDTGEVLITRKIWDDERQLVLPTKPEKKDKGGDETG